MTPAQLSDALLGALRDAAEAGLFTANLPDQVVVDRPKNPSHGDYATNIAMRLAKPAGLAPRELATVLADRFAALPGIASAEVAGPGFINIRLDTAALGTLARTIVDAGPAYGTTATLAGQSINLEFVSANPTGPIHVGGARWAAVGDALARVLEASGATVTREYYFNDHGSQIDRFARSLDAVARGLPAPEDGYGGQYINDIAAEVVRMNPDILTVKPDNALELFRRDGVELMFAEIKQTLAAFGVHFDVYFLERSLHETGQVTAAIERLRAGGYLFESDGALWLRTTEFGDDKDRVLLKSNGETTYFAADVAYYLNKRDRGADRVVIILGADHHGYIGRMRAMVSCYGENPDDTLEIIIGQMVNLVSGGEPVRMSKRAGTVVTIDDLVDAVGVDAARYALARSSIDSMLEIDLDLLARRSNDNPVYYVQYAHARLSAIARNAAELGIDRGAVAEFHPELLTHERETALLGALGEFPRVVASAAELREVHRVARYLEALAGTYHRFYDACRVLPMGDEPASDLAHARLWLCEATRVVLANGLHLLGVSAPERM